MKPSVSFVHNKSVGYRVTSGTRGTPETTRSISFAAFTSALKRYRYHTARMG